MSSTVKKDKQNSRIHSGSGIDTPNIKQLLKILKHYHKNVIKYKFLNFVEYQEFLPGANRQHFHLMSTKLIVCLMSQILYLLIEATKYR